MSAYLCDADHISACADILHMLKGSGYGKWDGLPESPEAIFTVLLNENLASLHARYSDTKEWDESSLFYIYQPQTIQEGLISCNPKNHADYACDYLKALSCLEYQSCEHEAWKESAAYRAIECGSAMLSDFILRSVPAYENAEWGWKARPRPLALVRRR